MGDVHLRSLVEDRFRIVQEQHEALRPGRHLRPLQLRRDRHRAGRLRVLVGDDAAVFPRRRRHDQRRRLGPSSAAPGPALPAACSALQALARSSTRCSPTAPPPPTKGTCRDRTNVLAMFFLLASSCLHHTRATRSSSYRADILVVPNQRVVAIFRPTVSDSGHWWPVFAESVAGAGRDARIARREERTYWA